MSMAMSIVDKYHSGTISPSQVVHTTADCKRKIPVQPLSIRAANEDVSKAAMTIIMSTTATRWKGRNDFIYRHINLPVSGRSLNLSAV